MTITLKSFGFLSVELPIYYTCNFSFCPSISIVRILKSMPMVVIKLVVNASSENRSSKQLLPTPACVTHTIDHQNNFEFRNCFSGMPIE